MLEAPRTSNHGLLPHPGVLTLLQIEMEELELKPTQLIAIASLAKGSTINRAASDAGVNERTIDRWLTQPAFRGELRRVITTAYKHHLTKLQGLLSKGIERLEDILDDPTTQPSDLIRTVHLLLGACDRYQESNLVERIEDLEQEINES